MFKKFPNNQKGAIALITLMAVSVFALIVVTTVSSLAATNHTMTSATTATETTFYAAEAGINEALFRLIAQLIPPPFALDINGINVEVNIQASGHQRTITSRATDPTGKVRTLQLAATSSAFAGGFDYAVQSGQGGIQIENNSKIFGDVYANGNVFGKTSGSPRAKIFGNAWVAEGQPTTAGPEQLGADTQLAVANESAKTDVAQSFILSTDSSLKKVSIYFKRLGTLPGDLNLRIVNGNGTGSPGTDTLVSETIPKNNVPTDFAWFNITFNIGPLLSAGQTYWLVLDSIGFDPANYIIWDFNTDNSNYPSGQAKKTNDFSTGTWTDLGGDFKFKTEVGIGDTFARYVKVNSHCSVSGNYETESSCVTAGGTWLPSNLSAHQIEGSVIEGDAYYQTIIDTTVSGSPCLNSHCYPSSPDPEPKPFPITETDITDWKTIAEAGGVINDDDSDVFDVSGTMHLGPKKIVGNLTLTDDAHLIIDGHLWVTGNIIFIKPNNNISLNSSFGEGSGTIIADGKVEVNNNAAISGSGDPKSFMLVISTNNSLDPLSPAINAANNSNSVLFYAHNGMVRQYNGSNLNATTGYYVLLEQVSSITYNPDLLTFYVPSGDSEEIDTIPDTWQEL